MKPLASISLDLDNQWSYQKTHGDAGWESFPSYLDILLPRTLDFFDRRGLKITYFVVGQDAVLDKNREALGLIVPAGHSVGNHSFNHEPWLHLYSPADIQSEISRAQDAFEQATGARPRGFRGPGFSVSTSVLDVLYRMEYVFDASTFPTYIGPLARAYYFMTANLSKADRKQRDALFGSMADGRRPVGPYFWQLEGPEPRQLLEIPVTTFPFVKAPFHLSYILYLSSMSPILATTYFRSALLACRASGVEPSLLLHPLDFLGGDEVSGLEFFPAMRLSGSLKRERISSYLELMRALFEVVSLEEHARQLQGRSALAMRRPDFAVQAA